MKKLLAIVMVAVMVLSMSAVAFAEEDAAPAYTVSYEAQENEDGTVTINVYAKGNIQAYDIGIIFKDAEPVKQEEDGEEVWALNGATGSLAMTNVVDLEDGSKEVVFTGASEKEKFKTYDGLLATFKFNKKGTFQLVLDTAIKEGGNTPAADPIEPDDVKPYQAPKTDAPEPPTTTPPTGDNQGDDQTPQNPQNPSNPTNTDPAKNGTTPAAKTADATPVAAMVTLVLMAGAVLVVLKKRAAE